MEVQLLKRFRSCPEDPFVNAGYWFSESKFPTSNIDSNLFTHLFCAFADINPVDKKVTISSSKLSDFSTFSLFVQLKNPNVKTLLSIGGDGANPAAFASMAAEADGRQSFIASSIRLAREFKFNGLNLHWLYPCSQTEMAYLDLLLNEWREAIYEEARTYHEHKLLLVASVYYSPRKGTVTYPISSMIRCLDWINVVAYDLYTPASSPKLTAPPAAFHNLGSETMCGSYGINKWIEEGFPAKRIAIGVCFHGRAWVLESPEKHAPFSPADGPETSTDTDGYADYVYIKNFIDGNEAESVYDERYVFSYCHSGKTWIGYDDEKSISTKVSAARRDGLLGYFAWHVAEDDQYCSLANAVCSFKRMGCIKVPASSIQLSSDNAYNIESLLSYVVPFGEETKFGEPLTSQSLSKLGMVPINFQF